MSYAKIEFEGTINELIALLGQHNLTGWFEATIKIEVGEPTEAKIIRELKTFDSFIPALKRYREVTGCSLKEAKDFIDQHIPSDHWPNALR
jgi:ribosomal protein L7/L12